VTSVDSVFKCVYFFLALCVLASEFLFFSNFEDVAVAMSQSLTLDLMIFAGWALVAALVIKKRPAFFGSSLVLSSWKTSSERCRYCTMTFLPRMPLPATD